MVNITGRLCFLITIEVVVTVVVVIVVLKKLTVIAAVDVAELILVIAGVQASIPIFLPLLLRQVLLYLILNHLSNTWIIDLGATDHMSGNRGIMFSFTPTSYSM